MFNTPRCIQNWPHLAAFPPVRPQVVFWDSEAPGFEGSRVQFSENSIFPIDITKGLETAWRSDR